MHIIQPAGCVDEYVRVVLGRIQVQMPNEVLGQLLAILVDNGNHAEPGQDDQGSFGCFKERYTS